MAEEHLRALLATGVAHERVVVAARRHDAASALAAKYGVESAPFDTAAAPKAVVAVSEDALVPVTTTLLARGVDRVLVEKPGSLRSSELSSLAGHVFVAYNRRFYPSVVCARELVEGDGGPLAVSFDFTEIEERVLASGHPAATLERWGIANSLHVIDLAFHLAGDPETLDVERDGALPWHPAGARFAGSGRTSRAALFAYLATWDGAGRWGIELTTRERRLVLRPLEELQEQRRGAFVLDRVDVPPEPEGVKPGLAGQLAAFLANDTRYLCDLREAVARLELAETIFGYDR